MSPLPPPNPAEGEAAALAADEARSTALAAVSAGTVTLEALLAEAQTGTPLGHIHARAALLALPKIGDVKADEILDGLGIKHDEHLDVLGVDQRAALVAEVASRS